MYSVLARLFSIRDLRVFEYTSYSLSVDPSSSLMCALALDEFNSGDVDGVSWQTPRDAGFLGICEA